MAFNLVGSAYGGAYPSLGTTLAVSPTTIGNWMIVSFYCSFPYAPSISGGPVASWIPLELDEYHQFSSGTWIGQITSTGPSTITLNSGYLYIGVVAQEFSVTGTPVLDSEAVLDVSDASPVTSANFPPLTAVGMHEFFWGTAILGPGSGFTTTTSGYSVQEFDGVGGGIIAVTKTDVSGVQSPDWDNSTPSGGTMVSVMLREAGGGKLVMII